MEEKGNRRVALAYIRKVESGLQYPRTMSSGCPPLPSCLRLPPSPTHSGRRSLKRCAAYVENTVSFSHKGLLGSAIESWKSHERLPQLRWDDFTPLSEARFQKNSAHETVP